MKQKLEILLAFHALVSCVSISSNKAYQYLKSETDRKKYLPASSKWPFDLPNGGHLAPEKVT